MGTTTRTRSAEYVTGMEHLVEVAQELSLARDLDTIMTIVRRAARELTGADGATFVLRDGDRCHYADEDAIAPLWKGMRFPMKACISGWVMLHRESVVIEDIYADPRIPADAYRPTFVKSLAMVPIRTIAPVGAIGNYWATRTTPSPDQLRLLQVLADSTSVAMENVQLFNGLEAAVRRKTEQLERSNAELEAFAYAVSHDLAAPLRAISGFSRILVEDHGAALVDDARELVGRIDRASRKGQELITDLLRLSRVGRGEVRREDVDLTALAHMVWNELEPGRERQDVAFVVAEGLRANADRELVRIALTNLLSNALKFTAKCAAPRIEVAAEERDGERVFVVRDNGAGFDPARASVLFVPFQRLHPQSEYAGNGVGLATVQRIVRRHGGRIAADATPGQGATFSFTLG